MNGKRSLAEEAQQNVSRDLAILGQLAKVPPLRPVLRLWQNHRCLVVGKSVAKQAAFDATREYFMQKQIPVVVRDTGGTVVPHGPGVLNISLLIRVAAHEKSVKQGYMVLCDGMISALGLMGIEASIGPVPGSYCDGDYNIIAGGKKLAGTAQRWRKCRDGSGDWIVLVHASISVVPEPEGDQAVANFYQLMDWRDVFDPTTHTSCLACLKTHTVSANSLLSILSDNLDQAFSASLRH